MPVDQVATDIEEPTQRQIMAAQLKQYQGLSLQGKVTLSKMKIRQWLDHWEDQCYVAFSGGKDSTVLLDLVWSIDPTIPAVFVDTGLEYPEIREFVKSYGDRVVWLKPKMRFDQVIKKYGYPVVSKEQAQFVREARSGSEKLKNIRLHGNKSGRGKVSAKWRDLLVAPFKVSEKCCDVMKKRPSKAYEKKTGRVPFLGTMFGESALRAQKYLDHGCNAFSLKRATSQPLSFWKDTDIWNYLNTKNIPYCPIYDEKGVTRTGCMFCMFGVHMEKGSNRFQRMHKSHPKQWNYCISSAVARCWISSG